MPPRYQHHNERRKAGSGREEVKQRMGYRTTSLRNMRVISSPNSVYFKYLQILAILF